MLNLIINTMPITISFYLLIKKIFHNSCLYIIDKNQFKRYILNSKPLEQFKLDYQRTTITHNNIELKLSMNILNSILSHNLCPELRKVILGSLTQISMALIFEIHGTSQEWVAIEKSIKRKIYFESNKIIIHVTLQNYSLNRYGALMDKNSLLSTVEYKLCIYWSDDELTNVKLYKYI